MNLLITALLCLVTVCLLLLYGNLQRWARSLMTRGSSKRHAKIAVSYSHVFPPSNRLSNRLSNAKIDLRSGKHDVDLNQVPNSLLGMKDDYREAENGKHLCSGYTVGDVRAMGNFPDYASLSGVPLPSPVPFDINTTPPRPYRPFRWNYHQTMGHSKLDIDYWIELESTYKERVQQRQELFSKYKDKVLQVLPGSELACKELMEMVIQFLCARYPQSFQLRGNTLINSILQTEHDLDSALPLQVLLDNVPEDFALMLRDEKTGRYFFRAGIICSSVGWDLGEKIGLDMAAIHGPVPDYKEKLAFSVDRFFSKMRTSDPLQRGAWGLEIGQPLCLPVGHPELAHRETQNPDLKPEDIYLRVDWQTLRRLPLSGAVAFNFKALFTPLTDFRNEPYVPSLLLKVLQEGKEEILKYKGVWHVEHVVKPALKEFENFQLEQRMMKKDWEPRTLEESPFYPGWHRNWFNSWG